MTSSDTELQELIATPVDADGVVAVMLGTAAWAVVGLVMWLGFAENLRSSGAGWWLWVPVVGFGLGLVGLPYVVRRRAAYQQAAASGDLAEGDAGQ